MSNRIEEILQLTDIKKFEIEIQDWVIENASFILEWYTDYAISTTIIKKSEEEQFIELEDKIEEFKGIIKNLINKESIDKIPYIFHRLIFIVIRSLRNSNIQNSMILNAIVEIYISALFELKIDDPETYSSLEPYQQFSPDTFYCLADAISKDNILVEIVDEEYWKDNIFKEIQEKEENKLLKYSIRSLILYCNTIQNRKRRLKNLKK